MSWSLLVAMTLLLGLALAVSLARQLELRRMRRAVDERTLGEQQGANEAKLMHPVVDLTRCMGCGKCVEVCPEKVLGMVHGQAAVVHSARCVGVAECERECPVSAIAVTVANQAERTDIPAVTDELEAIGQPGVFLAGEVTAHALIKTAVEHGAWVGAEVARRVQQNGANGVLDLCVVGLGPAGLACSLEARRHGLNFVALDQEQEIGGTVAKYPRRKLVLTEPVDLPLHGHLADRTYTKEELIGIWEEAVAEHDLPVIGGETFVGLERDNQGRYVVRTETDSYVAHHVCLALGRRGVPRRLGVPGEELPHVAYSLLDARSYRGRRILVVGGGDSAGEAALALAEQFSNEVTIAYRKESFFRMRERQRRRIEDAIDDGRIHAFLNTEVVSIEQGAVRLRTGQSRTGPSRTDGDVFALENDEVFVMAGGVPPVALLESAGVSFDAALRETPAPIRERGSGLWPALAAAFVLTLIALVWATRHADYYGLPMAERPMHEKHEFLRPGQGIGLALGIFAAGLIVVNLLYLARRSDLRGVRFGSLKGWMTSHVATGILALLCATLHGAMMPGHTVGGRAFWALVVLGITGAIGRYFYAYVPRAANGRELELTEIRARLAELSANVEHYVARNATDRQWSGSFFGRVAALFGFQRDLRRTIGRIRRDARREELSREELQETIYLAKRAYRTALMAAHFEDVRGLLQSWRWLHRWIALLMVVLVAIHVWSALAYGDYF